MQENAVNIMRHTLENPGVYRLVAKQYEVVIGANFLVDLHNVFTKKLASATVPWTKGILLFTLTREGILYVSLISDNQFEYLSTSCTVEHVAFLANASQALLAEDGMA
ncbi:MAG: hypothetical protein ACOYL5_06275 [Phototrophicaceae bacterium]|jgi:hypothetical protein